MKVNVGNDLLLSQVRRGVNFYETVMAAKLRHVDYDLVFAHETFCSGLAGLYVAQHFRNAVKILDIVEYPAFDQRTSANLRNAGLINPVSTELTTSFAVNIANRYDFVYATSNGQRNIMAVNGCNVQIDLLRNCREYQKVASNSYLSDRFAFSEQDIIILFSNRAYEYCGLELAIEGLADLDKRYKLVVLGDVVPGLKSKAEDLAKRLNVQDRYFVTGMLDPSLVLPVIAGADVVLSLIEPKIDNHRWAMPNRIFDAIMAQVPVLVMNDTELAGFVKQYNIGKIVTSPTKKAYLAALKELFNEAELLRENLKMAAREFCWEEETSVLQNNLPNFQGASPKCLFLANKDIGRNDRVRRLLKTICNTGYETDVITQYYPMESMRVDGVNYHAFREGQGNIEKMVKATKKKNTYLRRMFHLLRNSYQKL